MDAVKYLKDKARMTKADNSVHDDLCGISCDECPLYDENNGMKVNCQNLESFYPEKSVEIVEKWAKENPKKTRQSEFLKMFPNAKLEKGVIRICPQHIEGEDNYACVISAGLPSCTGCRKKYWLTEVE